jgi:NAD/NADP transhydrogenase beta subunit
VISLLNSYSGIAACATGFVLDNSTLVVSGSLVAGRPTSAPLSGSRE